MTHIKVVDSPTGTGKTSMAIDYINSLPKDKHIIYITPYNDECKRIVECTNKNFIAPDVKKGKGRKLVHFLDLVRKEKNIAATHSLFTMISDEVIEALQQSDYILILDEAFNVVKKYDMFEKDREYQQSKEEEKKRLTKQNIQSFLNKGYIKVEDDYRVKWVDYTNWLPKYETFRRLCDRDLIYLVHGELLLWSFPIEVFQPNLFSEIYILCYQFEYQMQYYYYNYFGVQYDKYHIEKIDGKFKMIPTVNQQYEYDWIENAKRLITIEESLNKKGIFLNKQRQPIETAMSKTWYSKNRDKVEILRKSAVNFFANYTDTKGNERMWTCFTDDENEYRKDKNLAKKNWVAINARAVNNFGNRTALFYPVNRYTDPFYLDFFKTKGIKINADGFALSEMIQWIWRSAIRNNQPIKIFIPSARMRNLLKNFLDHKPLNFVDAENNRDEIEDEYENVDSD